MLHFWKSAKQKRVYDTASGAVLTLNSLEYKMIQAIIPPLSPLCPSSLRYELAKYDSADVEETYENIYKLFCNKILFAENQNDLLALRVGGTYGVTPSDDCIHEIASFLDGKIPSLIVADGISQEDVTKIRNILAKNG